MKKMTWRSLNQILSSLNESEVLAMLELERGGEKRLSVLLRLHQRYSVLRAGRERGEIFKVAAPDGIDITLEDGKFNLYIDSPRKSLKIVKSKEEKSPKAYLLDMIKGRMGCFSKGIIGSPFHKICDELSREFPDKERVTQSDLELALKSAGWIDRGRVNSRELNAKKQVYASTELDHLSKSDLRRLVN